MSAYEARKKFEMSGAIELRSPEKKKSWRKPTNERVRSSAKERLLCKILQSYRRISKFIMHINFELMSAGIRRYIAGSVLPTDADACAPDEER